MQFACVVSLVWLFLMWLKKKRLKGWKIGLSPRRRKFKSGRIPLKCFGRMKVNASRVYMCYVWKPLLTDQWDGVEVGGGEKLSDLRVCASACALVMRHLRNPLFCDDDSVACMPIAMAPRHRSFDMTTAPIDVLLLSLT